MMTADSTTFTNTTTAYKSWNFDPGEELHGVSFAPIADAAGYGMAQEFAVVGRSTWDTVRFSPYS